MKAIEHQHTEVRLLALLRTKPLPSCSQLSAWAPVHSTTCAPVIKTRITIQTEAKRRMPAQARVRCVLRMCELSAFRFHEGSESVLH
jgi:hypothetical protein